MVEFLSMEGYGVFVWTSWGVGFLVIGWISVSATRRLKRIKSNLARLEANNE